MSQVAALEPQLPLEIWAAILSFITRRGDFTRVRAVCWNWLQLVPQSRIIFRAKFSDFPKLLVSLPFINSLSLVGYSPDPLSPKIMNAVLRATNLRNLEVLGAHPRMLPYITALPLTRLALLDLDRFDDDGNELSAPLCEMRAAALACGLFSLSGLEELDLCMDLQNSVFPGVITPCFATWTRLRKLLLFQLPSVNALTHLCRLSGLALLYLDNWNGLQLLTNLRALSVSLSSPNATVLQECTFLQVLKLHKPEDNDSSFYRRLTRLVSLETANPKTPFTVLTSLASLAHYSLAVDNYSPLTRLTKLWLHCYPKSYLTSLTPLTRLQHVLLYCFGQPTTGDSHILHSLATQSQLRTLVWNLNDANEVLDFEPLKALTTLEQFKFFYKNSDHLTSLRQVLTHLSNLREIVLFGRYCFALVDRLTPVGMVRGLLKKTQSMDGGSWISQIFSIWRQAIGGSKGVAKSFRS